MRTRKKAPKVIKEGNLTIRHLPSTWTGKGLESRPADPFYSDEARSKAIAVLESLGGEYDGDEKVWFREFLSPKYPLLPTAPNATVYYDLHRGTWKSEQTYIAQNPDDWNRLQEKAHAEGVFAGVLIRERNSDTWIPEWAKATGAI